MRVSLPYDRPISANVQLRRRGILPGLGALVLLAYPLLTLLLTSLSFFVRPTTGLFAVAQLFAPHLYLPLLLLVPFAFRRASGGAVGVVGLRIVLFMCLCLFCLRYLPSFSAAAPVPTPGAAKVSVLTWNAFASNRTASSIEGAVSANPADVVVLQEADGLSLSTNDAIAALYPYRLLRADGTPPGMALLSKYPIRDNGVYDGARGLWDIPRLMWARLDLGGGNTVTVVDAHPISPYYSGGDCQMPVCFDPTLRDRQITAIRHDYLQPLIDSGEPFILAGDFNMSEREPIYSTMSGDLTDTFKAVGAGFGTSWRPQFVMSQPFGLLRIDYLWTGPSVAPLSVSTDCTPRHSDHCVLTGTFELAASR